MPDRFPLVFSTLGCPDWTLERAAEEAVKDGYVGLEVRVLDGQIIPPDLDATGQQRIRKVMADTGLVIVGLGASTRFSSPDVAERQAQEAQLRQYLRLARALDVPYVRTFGGDVAPGHTIDETVDWLAASLANVMDEAEAQGVTVLLETHDAFCRGQEVARVLAKVDHPRLKAVWDVHHPYRKGESIEDTWRFIGAHCPRPHQRRPPQARRRLAVGPLGRGRSTQQSHRRSAHERRIQGLSLGGMGKEVAPQD
ncbi:MAG: sugar phosphate isomerase/epimerase family protein [Caldilineaceae bacterium]